MRLFLRAKEYPQFDEAHVEFGGRRRRPSPQIEQVHELLADIFEDAKAVPIARQLSEARRIIDEGFTGQPNDAESLGVNITAVKIGRMPAEWVIAPGAAADRRLLYLHGGGFVIGSPRSHRMLTSELSRRCKLAVLAIDYRLAPENRQIDAVRDCRAGYRWMLENGPDGTSDAREVFVAGDSAGGNLTLGLSNWTRDEGLRVPDGVIAFSPSTDMTLGGISIRGNLDTDPMLGPALGFLAKMPKTLQLLAITAAGRSNPRNPVISPLFADLSGLPPTLVQASDSEMLLDDARRYVSKARLQGSPVTLQTWPGMVHVWPMFHQMLPEGGEALDQVARFVERISSGRAPLEPVQEEAAVPA
ncbi:MAG: alpha/beta hydrolase [Gammaproteobacteria bacterium]|nr:alpha/beta hydrolase [Gammaproteobacteria bacterium]